MRQKAKVLSGELHVSSQTCLPVTATVGDIAQNTVLALNTCAQDAGHLHFLQEMQLSHSWALLQGEDAKKKSRTSTAFYCWLASCGL